MKIYNIVKVSSLFICINYTNIKKSFAPPLDCRKRTLVMEKKLGTVKISSSISDIMKKKTEFIEI